MTYFSFSHRSPFIQAARMFIVLLALVLASCGSAPEPVPGTEALPPKDPSSPSSEEDEPLYAETRPPIQDRDTLTVAVFSDPPELDFRKSYLAAEAQLFTALYEGLFSYHPYTMEPMPAVASSWNLSEDKKQWTFTLRERACYWNGDPVRAEDFRAAWLSLLDPRRESPYSSLFDVIEGAREYRMGQQRDPRTVGIEAPNDRTLVVRLNAPAAFFPSMLCHHSFSPIHPSMVGVDDWSRSPPLSNGPFYIVENQGDTLIMAKSSRYWDAAQVGLNRLIYRYTQDEDEASHFWNSGEARWVSGSANFETITDRSGIMVNALFATHYYYIRSDRAPWKDHRIRRALALALPWKEIREGFRLPAETLIYPVSGYPEVSGISAPDLAEARRLLAEAGYPGGAGLPELVIRITPGEGSTMLGGLMAAVWMEELGVQVRIEVIPATRYFQSLKQDGYEVGSTTWIGDFADPYTFLQMWRRNSNLNDARYDNDEYEALLDRSMGEEGEERWKTLAEAEALLLNQGTVLPIYYSSAVNILDVSEVEGWFPNVLDIHPFKYLNFRAHHPLPGVALGNRHVP